VMQVRVFLLCLLGAVGVFGQTPSFPSQVASDLDLLVACSASESTLSTALDSTSTTVTVASSASFCQYQMIQIDNERMVICSVGSGTLTLCTGTRGFDGTSAASHSSGAAVRGLGGRYHHNRMREEVQAIETALGANLVNIPTLSSEFTVAGQIPKAVTSSGRVMEPSTCKEVGGVFSCGSGTSPGQIDVKNQTGPTLTEPSTGMSGYGASSTGAPLFRTYGSSTVELVTSSTGVTSASTIGDGKLVVGSGGSRGVAASSLTGIVKSTSGTPSAAGYADVTALWASGACSGYLKSDGTCGTPSGGSSYDVFDRTVAQDIDDFISRGPSTSGTYGMGKWNWSAPNCHFFNPPTDYNRPGIIGPSIDSSGSCTLEVPAGEYLGGFGDLAQFASWEMRFAFRSYFGSDGHSSYKVGLFNNLTSGYGVYLRFLNGTDTNWTWVGSKSGSTVTRDSGVSHSTAWLTLRIRSTTAGTWLLSVASGTGDFGTEVSMCASGCDMSFTPQTYTGYGPAFVGTSDGSSTAILLIDYAAYKMTISR
jgi:hypothetical protein